jgi:hypothetical protein
MTPPQLTRDTPVLHVLHPSGPVLSGDLGLNLELASFRSLNYELHLEPEMNETHLESFGGHRLAADPPLGLHDLFDNIARSRTDGDLHFVVLLLNVQALLLERFDDLVPDVESFHALFVSFQHSTDEGVSRTLYSPAFSLYVPSSFMRLMNSRLFR